MLSIRDTLVILALSPELLTIFNIFHRFFSFTVCAVFLIVSQDLCFCLLINSCLCLTFWLTHLLKFQWWQFLFCTFYSFLSKYAFSFAHRYSSCLTVSSPSFMSLTLLNVFALYSCSNCRSIILLALVSPEVNLEKIQVQVVYLGGEGNVWETARILPSYHISLPCPAARVLGYLHISHWLRAALRVLTPWNM